VCVSGEHPEPHNWYCKDELCQPHHPEWSCSRGALVRSAVSMHTRAGS